MLVGFREYGWCQLSDGSMLVHIPWGYAEEALREILQRLSPLSRSNRDNDSLSAEGRLARDIAVALENPNNGNSVVRSHMPYFYSPIHISSEKEMKNCVTSVCSFLRINGIFKYPFCFTQDFLLVSSNDSSVRVHDRPFR
jgi:hypothetical protein